MSSNSGGDHIYIPLTYTTNTSPFNTMYNFTAKEMNRMWADVQQHYNYQFWGQGVINQGGIGGMASDPGYHMRKIGIGNRSYDPSNITGRELAEIGKAALYGKKLVDMNEAEKNKGAGNIIDAAWLDNRVEEMCRKGRL